MKKAIRCLLVVFCALLCCFTIGCGWLADNIAESLAQAKIKELNRQVTISKGKGQEFTNCLNEAGLSNGGTSKRKLSEVPADLKRFLESKSLTHLGFSKKDIERGNLSHLTEGLLAVGPNALLATRVLEHPVHQEMMSLRYKTAEVKSSTQDSITVVFEEKQIDDYMQLVEQVTSQQGWDSLAFVADRHMKQVATEEATAFANETNLIAAYMKAYFRAGKFATITLNDQKLRDALKSSLGIEDPSSIYELLFGNLFKPDPRGNGQVFGSIGKVAFVARGGDSYQFPAIQPTLNVTAARPLQMSKIDFIAVGSDLVRVLLEAILDAEFRVPGVSNSTGVEEKILEDFNKLSPRPITEDQFGVVEQVSKAVEGGVSSAVGRVVRGVGMLSLNNESLATLIETFAGVALKKVSEKVCWCYFKTKNAQLTAAAAKSTAFVDTNPVTINLVIRGRVPLAFNRL